jgi:metal-responsive CopG/Arc/MetJ family transcriptional regulator
MLYKKPKIVKKPAIGVKKVTVSLPPEILTDLDHISGLVGLSRSAFLSSILAQSLPEIKATVDALAEIVTKATAESDSDPVGAQQRYNSHSKKAIDDFILKLTSGGQDDLFNGK